MRFAAVIMLVLSLSAFGASTNYYVSTVGSDSNAGSLASPFLTLGKAQAALRAAGPFSEGATVHLRAGTYLLSATLALTEQDSGVTWRGYSTETAQLLGALPLTNWVAYTGNVYCVDASTQGLAGVNFRQLFWNGTRQIMARTPNYNAADPLGTNTTLMVGTNGTYDTTSFLYRAGDLSGTWLNPTQAEVFVFPSYNYWNDILPVSAIDTGTRTITLGTAASYTIQNNDRYFVRGLREELDVAGEWHRDTNDLTYFWPPSALGSTPVYVPTLVNLVSIAAGVSNLTLRNLTLEYCTGPAVTVTNATNCLIAANILNNVGDYSGAGLNRYLPSGVYITGGLSNRVMGNDITYPAMGGIVLSGGTEQTLISSSHLAENNYIHHVGELFKQGTGIWLEGVGNYAKRNVIYHGPRFGIFFRGNNHLVEGNECYDLMRETDDGSIIYTYAVDWLNARGSAVRYNYLHDATGYGWSDAYRQRYIPSLTYGIYLDGYTCGVDVFGNIVTHTSGAGIFVNRGSYNYISNNIIRDCTHPIPAIMNYSPQLHTVGLLTNNASWTTLAEGTFLTHYYQVDAEPAWNNMRLDTAPTNYSFGLAGYTTASNRFFHNIFSSTNTSVTPWLYYSFNFYYQNLWDYNTLFNGGVAMSAVIYTNAAETSLADWQAMGQDVNSITNDPLLNLTTWQVDAGSPALAAGFVQIPFSSIGAYYSTDRATWPLGVASGSGSIVTLRATTLNVRTMIQQ